MEYQEIKNLLENIPNKPSLFKKKNESRRTYNKDNQIRFKT